MRKISKILFAGIIMSSALSTYAQTQIMTVKKTDGSKVIYKLSDVERVSFDDLTVAPSFESGEGKQESPYKIANANQLLLMAKYINEGNPEYVSAYYELTNDIDLLDIEWTPIGDGKNNESLDLAENGGFTGVFNGNNHTISNLCINTETNEKVAMFGLFGFVGKQGQIQNLKVKGNVNVKSTFESDTEKNFLACGGIIGHGINATLTNCSFEGSVKAQALEKEAAAMAGGVAGSITGNLINCSATISQNDIIQSISSYTVAGALAGYANAGNINMCKSVVKGNVKTENGIYTLFTSTNYAGGLIGNSFGGNVTNCEVIVDGNVIAYAVPETDAENSGASAYAGGMCGGYGADANSNNTIIINGLVKAEGCGVTAAGGANGMQENAGYSATLLTTNIAGSVLAENHGTSNNRMCAYAGGVYGSVSFQMGLASLSNCISTISGTVKAKSAIAAYCGGVVGSASVTVANRSIITSTGIVASEAPKFATTGGVVGNALGNSCACYSIIDGTLSVSAAEQGSQVGGVFGSMIGNKRAPKSALACYSLINGKIESGETSMKGAISGFCNAFSKPKSCYWWSKDESFANISGVGEDSEGKLAACDKEALTEAMNEMNTAITENGNYNCSFTYNETDNVLDVVINNSEEESN